MDGLDLIKSLQGRDPVRRESVMAKSQDIKPSPDQGMDSHRINTMGEGERGALVEYLRNLAGNSGNSTLFTRIETGNVSAEDVSLIDKIGGAEVTKVINKLHEARLSKNVYEGYGERPFEPKAGGKETTVMQPGNAGGKVDVTMSKGYGSETGWMGDMMYGRKTGQSNDQTVPAGSHGAPFESGALSVVSDELKNKTLDMGEGLIASIRAKKGADRNGMDGEKLDMRRMLYGGKY